jgi:hypothetical protein
MSTSAEIRGQIAERQGAISALDASIRQMSLAALDGAMMNRAK